METEPSSSASTSLPASPMSSVSTSRPGLRSHEIGCGEEEKMKGKRTELDFTIRKSWDGRNGVDETQIKITFSRRRHGIGLSRGSGTASASASASESRGDGGETQVMETNKLRGKEKEDEEEENDDSLVIRVDAPFFDEPRVGENIPEGSVDKLWEYEVVEVFFLGIDNKYLEIELAPRGHYLLLILDGHGNILQYQLPLKSYETVIEGNRWVGEAIIPNEYLPTPITRFNAYAIHKAPPHRQYMALFPTPTHKYEEPNFHRLDYFQPIDLSQLLP